MSELFDIFIVTFTDINYLINFCEYTYNLSIYSQGTLWRVPASDPASFYLQQVNKVIDMLGYLPNGNEGITDFVPKSADAIAVSEIVDASLSYKIIEYNHHSMQGDLEKKKNTILLLANQLESQRDKLKQINKTLEEQIFFLFNNINIRHNNVDKESKDYKEYIAEMDKKELENWYDETYQLCLLAFLELDNLDRREKINDLKRKIGK